MSDYTEHLISMAGGDGDVLDLDAIQARAEINKYLGKTASQDEAKDTLALLAMVREQRAVLERVEAVLTAIETHASLDSSPVEYRTVGGWVDVEDALTAALTATEAS